MQKSFLRAVYALLALASYSTLGQTVSTDSSLTEPATGSLQRQYAAARGRESRLFSGPEYVNRLPGYLTGHPYFNSPQAQPATVVYAGSTYADVPLRYDLMQGLLVLNAPQNGGRLLQLVNEKVARFTLAGHTFIRVVTDSASGAPVRTGYYDLLLDGPVRLLASREKNMQRRSTDQGMVGEITQRDELFLYHALDRRYYPAGSSRAVLKLFPDQKAALRKHIRTRKLRFRGASRESDFAELLRYQATLAAPTTRPPG